MVNLVVCNETPSIWKVKATNGQSTSNVLTNNLRKWRFWIRDFLLFSFECHYHCCKITFKCWRIPKSINRTFSCMCSMSFQSVTYHIHTTVGFQRVQISIGLTKKLWPMNRIRNILSGSWIWYKCPHKFLSHSERKKNTIKLDLNYMNNSTTQ
jgi:hypothetical protein